MKALMALALILSCGLAHAKIVESADAQRTDPNVGNVFGKSDSADAVNDPPSPLVQSASLIDVAPMPRLAIDSNQSELPRAPSRATPAPAIGTTGLAQALLKRRDFSMLDALIWSMMLGAFCISSLILLRAASFLRHRHAELRDHAMAYRRHAGTDGLVSWPTRLLIDEDSSAPPLSSTQVASFRSQGFLVLERPQVVDSEVESMRDCLARLFDRRDDEGQFFSLTRNTEGGARRALQLLDPALCDRTLRRFSHAEAALALARQLLGPGAIAIGEYALVQPANHGSAIPWHQDEAFRDPHLDYREISVSMVLTAAGADSGAPRYVPRSHLCEVLPHRLAHDAADAVMLECEPAADADEALLCPLPAGGVVIHNGRTVHGNEPNHSDQDCIVYVRIFATSPIPRAEPREFPWLSPLHANRGTEPVAWPVGADKDRARGWGSLLHRRQARVPDPMLAAKKSSSAGPDPSATTPG